MLADPVRADRRDCDLSLRLSLGPPLIFVRDIEQVLPEQSAFCALGEVADEFGAFSTLTGRQSELVRVFGHIDQTMSGWAGCP